MTEIYFKKHWKTFSLAIIVVLGFEALCIPLIKNLWEKNDYYGIFLLHILVLLLLLGFTYPLILNRKIIFYDEGISYINYFSRRFTRWHEVQEVRDISRNQYPIILLKSPTGKAKIHLSEFVEKDELITFLKKKLSHIT